MNWIILGIPLGIILLYFGSDWLVKGAKGLAIRLGISPFVVGLTVVAFGSSAPECITSIVSTDTPSLILGNVVGSNIANIGVAIALAAIISPMVAKYSTMRVEMGVMLGTALLLVGFALIGFVGVIGGVLMIIGLFVFITFVYKMKKNDAEGQVAYSSDVEPETRGYPMLIVMVLLGLVLLYYGATFFIDGATELATMIGVSDLMIGLIVVAVGTSLPEICICLLAARRGENDLAVSNIVGSNIFNILFVLGIGAVLVDVPIPSTVLYFHLPVMLLLSVIMFLSVRQKNSISRPVAMLMLGIYVAYIAVMAAVPSLTL